VQEDYEQLEEVMDTVNKNDNLTLWHLTTTIVAVQHR
jgi:hypothetical protein